MIASKKARDESHWELYKKIEEKADIFAACSVKRPDAMKFLMQFKMTWFV